LELDSGMIVVRLGAWSYGARKASQEAWPLGNTKMVSSAADGMQVQSNCTFAQK